MAQGPNRKWTLDSKTAYYSPLWKHSSGSVVNLRMRPPGTPFTSLDTFMAAHSPRRFCQTRQNYILKPLTIESKISDGGFSAVYQQKRINSGKTKHKENTKMIEEPFRDVQSPHNSTSGTESSENEELTSVTQRVLTLGKCKLSNGEDFLFPCENNSNNVHSSSFFRPGPRVSFPPSRTCALSGGTSAPSTNELIAIGTIPMRLQRQSIPKPMSRWKTKATLNLKGSKYPDPMMGAGPGIQARIAEMAQLEVDTIRYEKTKKTKKKTSSS